MEDFLGTIGDLVIAIFTLGLFALILWLLGAFP